MDQYSIYWLDRVETNYEIDSEYILKSLSNMLNEEDYIKKFTKLTIKRRFDKFMYFI